MFTRFHSRLPWIVALLTLVGSAAGSATTVAWSPTPLRAGPGWARTPSTSPIPASIRASSASDQAPETFLYTGLIAFKGFADGFWPSGGLTEDAGGSLYGTTQCGGLDFPSGNTEFGGGVVFKLTRTGSRFAFSVIYKFGASGPDDGYGPTSVNGLAIDSTGALYGTTSDTATEGGTVYKLEPTAHGYRETILYTFLLSNTARDGVQPLANPILDRSGALYGTTEFGGGVYKLTPTKSGYSFSVLHTFGSAPDGEQPWGGLLLDEKTGDLYGTTAYGGVNQNGIVFRLSPTASGYRYKIIHWFDHLHGGIPFGSLMMDSAGALYGTTSAGGLGHGTVYKLTPASTGYVETVLYEFTDGTDGRAPSSGLVADRSGNLYGMAYGGGQYGGGTVFKLVPTRSGYREVTLHAFNPEVDGQLEWPTELLIDGDYLFGETEESLSKGSAAPNGTVFDLKII